MAHAIQTSTDALGAAFNAGFKAVVKVLKSIVAFAEIVMEANSRAGQIERMNNLTDVELATKYGINRDQIVAHVFRDRMF